MQDLILSLIEKNEEEVLYIIICSLISADNNLTNDEVKENNQHLSEIYPVLQNIEKYKEISDKIIQYLNKYGEHNYE